MRNFLLSLIVLLLVGCDDGIDKSYDNYEPYTPPVEVAPEYGWYQMRVGENVNIIIELPETTLVWVPDAYTEIGILCNDGTRSYSTTRQGTCSWHGGVYDWEYVFDMPGYIEVHYVKSVNYRVVGQIYNPHLASNCFVVVHNWTQKMMLFSQDGNVKPTRCGESGYVRTDNFLTHYIDVNGDGYASTPNESPLIPTDELTQFEGAWAWKYQAITNTINLVTFISDTEIVYEDGTQSFENIEEPDLNAALWQVIN